MTSHHNHHAAASPFLYDVEEANFDPLVVERSRELPVLVDIGADWCSPCLVLAPLLEKLVGEFPGRLAVARVDADENMRIAGRHQVRGFPTVIAYCHGREVERFHSTKPMHFLRELAERVITRHDAERPA
jgi:putative thioredoxin